MKSKLFCKYFLIVFCCASYLFVPPPAHANQPLPTVYINEVNWAGSALSTADEWLELLNPTSEDISLAQWKIVGAGASNKNLVLPSDAVIPAHSTFLIANFDWNDPRTALLNEPNLTTSTLSLSNSILIIELFDDQNNLIDMAGNAEAPPAGSSGIPKISMQRVDYSLPGYEAGAWANATISDGLSTDDLGTPGWSELPAMVYDPLPDESANEDPIATSTDDVDQEEPVVNEEQLWTDAASTTSLESSSEEITNNQSSEPIMEITTSTTTAATTTEATFNTTSTNTVAVTITTDNQPASTTTIINSSQQVIGSNTETDNQQTSAQDDVSNQNTIRLNEIMTYPTEGPEWIEITSALTNGIINLEGMTIHDAAGKILTLNGSLTPDQPFMVFSLNSAKLNNGGDTVYLKNANGQDVDILIYDSSKKGVSWSLDESGHWQETTTSTPGAANIFSSANPAVSAGAQVQNQPAVDSAAVKTTPATGVHTTNAATKSTAQTTAQNTPTGVKTDSPAPVTAKQAMAASTKTAGASKTSTAAKAQTGADKNTLTEINFDMLKDSTYGGIKVRLRGQVGTPAQLLTSRAFILLNQDGRGLMVKVPTDRKMPDYGTLLEVTGTLKFDSRDLPYLSVSTKDEWQTLNQEITDLKFHNSSLFAPSAEDAWSLVNVTGTVLEVKSSSFTILVDEIEIQVKIRPGVNYRAKRLIKNDLVNIAGILDISGEMPTILPRSAEEIQLISHEQKTEAAPVKAQKNGVPGWTPFGAAAGAIGTIEGFKRARTHFKKIKIKA